MWLSAVQKLMQAGSDFGGVPRVMPNIKRDLLATSKHVKKSTGKHVKKPTRKPIMKPTAKPIMKPTGKPIMKPTSKPVKKPTAKPIMKPSSPMPPPPSPMPPPSPSPPPPFVAGPGGSDFSQNYPFASLSFSVRLLLLSFDNIHTNAEFVSTSITLDV